MKGTYKIIENGEVIAEADNLLTDSARRTLLRYLAGVDRSWAGAIAVGSYPSTPSVADRHLGFEIGRGDVELRAPDLAENAVIVKATIPKGVVGIIHELGLYSSTNITGRENDQLLITDFDTDIHDTEGLDPGLGRVGQYSAVVRTEGGFDTMGRMFNLGFDISALGQDDLVMLAYSANAVGPTEIRLYNDDEAYVSRTFSPQSGYHVETWRISQFTSVAGGTILEPFTEIRLMVGGSGVEGEISFDGLRVDDTDVFEDQVLVSRALLPSPIEKTAATDFEVEYAIRFDF